MKKSLYSEKDLAEIHQRIMQLTPNSQRKWGKMEVAQMLLHCDKILQISVGKVVLPKKNIFIKTIGIITKKEMRVFNNGIPHNMPTFNAVKITENCNFEKSRAELLQTLEEYILKSKNGNLLSYHELFGKMEHYDWGFLEYKHLNHHLNQFGV